MNFQYMHNYFIKLATNTSINITSSAQYTFKAFNICPHKYYNTLDHLFTFY